MIPRRIAKLLLAEFIEQVDPPDHDDRELLEGCAERVVAESFLVLRGAENVEQKARRYLMEGRVVVERRDPDTGYVVATCRGTEATYHLGYDPRPGRRQWRCTCRAPRGHCAHLIALRLIVPQPDVRAS